MLLEQLYCIFIKIIAKVRTDDDRFYLTTSIAESKTTPAFEASAESSQLKGNYRKGAKLTKLTWIIHASITDSIILDSLVKLKEFSLLN